jgi:hypothetical protein
MLPKRIPLLTEKLKAAHARRKKAVADMKEIRRQYRNEVMGNQDNDLILDLIDKTLVRRARKRAA